MNAKTNNYDQQNDLKQEYKNQMKENTGKGVYSWGAGLDGATGHGSVGDCLEPRANARFLSAAVWKVACGSSHTALLTVNGQLWTWGSNLGGQLCDYNPPKIVTKPRKVASRNFFVDVAAGAAHTALVTDRWKVKVYGIFYCPYPEPKMEIESVYSTDDYCFGLARDQKTVHWCSQMDMSKFNSPIKQISAGREHVAILTEKRELFMGGLNQYGEIPCQGTLGKVLDLVELSLKFKVNSVFCGAWCTYFVSDDSKVYYSGVSPWLKGIDGHVIEPLHMSSFDGLGITTISCSKGNSFAAGLTAQGSAYTWGYNSKGQLGHGGRSRIDMPVALPNNVYFAQLDCGSEHMCGIGKVSKSSFVHDMLGLFKQAQNNYTAEPENNFAVFVCKNNDSQCSDRNEAINDKDNSNSNSNNSNSSNSGDNNSNRNANNSAAKMTVAIHKAILHATCPSLYELCRSTREPIFLDVPYEPMRTFAQWLYSDTLVPSRVHMSGQFKTHLVTIAKEYGKEAEMNRHLHADTIVENLKYFVSLVNNVQDSDIAFRVEGKLFHCHKFLLIARCTHFKLMLCGNYSERNESVIDLPDIAADTFEDILHFIYTDHVKSGEGAVTGDNVMSLLHASTFFHLPRLQYMCEELLFAETNRDNVFEVLHAAHAMHCLKLKTYCFNFIAANTSREERFQFVDRVRGANNKGTENAVGGTESNISEQGVTDKEGDEAEEVPPYDEVLLDELLQL